MVAMVGLDVIRMGEDTPMDCEGKCAEWDIRNEFETIDVMPVYYGGDLCDFLRLENIILGRCLCGEQLFQPAWLRLPGRTV